MTATVRILKHSDILRCQHVILMPTHYREDGSCRCTDSTHTEMAEWGYVWDDRKRQWVAGPDESAREGE